jgi:catechol 2,3-dioxygenase
VAALDQPGGGMGLRVSDPSGRIFQIVHDDLRRVLEPGDPDRPVRLAHVVLNCQDQGGAQRFVERAFGFVLSDRTRLMAFMNCNRDHHTIALATAENDALNHIAFLMPTLDAVMRGAGRMRDHGHPIEWGPGRHGPGNNAFNYFIDPFGVVIEYTAEVAQIDQSYQPRGPADWVWPRGRSDQWGIGVGPSARLKEAQQQVFFEPSHASEYV